MPVGNLATENVRTVDRETSLTDLVRLMADENVGSVVVTEDDRPVGLVTDRKVAMAVADEGEFESKTVADVMTEDPVTIREDQEGYDIAKTMGEHRIRRLPVVDDDGRLTGIVTLDDVVSIIGEQMADVADVIEAQSPDYAP